MHALGLRVIMATGDNERTARAVAAKLGIDVVRAGVLPEDKKYLIDDLRAQGRKIAMAGNGVNDAPCPRRRCGYRHGHRSRCGNGNRWDHSDGR
jgi:P-type E1-E2 ATPase